MRFLRLLPGLVEYLREERKLWLLPLLLVLLLVGAIALVTSSDAVAPLIYTLF